MLARASRQALRHNVCKPSLLGFEALQLPFLCPALYGPRSTFRNTSSSTEKCHSSKPKPKQSRPQLLQRASASSPAQHRHLASAAAAVAYEHDPYQDDFIPFEHWSPSENVAPAPRQNIPFDISLRGFDPNASPLIINDAPTTEAPKFRAIGAVSGDLNEIHQTLHACLQVGRLERASALMRRLNQIYKPDAPGLIAAHNDYIREITLRIVRTKDSKLMKGLQRWFEVDLRQTGVIANAATYALMIQASMHGGMQEGMIRRSVRRYTHFATEAGLLDETMNLVSSLEETSEQALKYMQKIEKETSQQILSNWDEPTQDVQTDAPLIRPVDQKGLGLSTLKKSLATLYGSEASSNRSSDHVHRNDDQHKMYRVERQRALERNTLEAALDRWHEEDAHLKSVGVVNALSTSSLGAIMWKWHEKLAVVIGQEMQKALEAESKESRSNEDEERLVWGPYLQGLTPEKLSAITILTCTKSVSLETKDERGTKVVTVVNRLGSAVQDETLYDNMKENRSYRQWRALSQKKRPNKTGDKVDLVPADSEQEFERLEWSQTAKIKIGAMLLSHLIDVAKVEVSRPDPEAGSELREEQPAFFHTFSYMGGKRIGVIRLNPTMKEKMSKAPMGAALAKHLPMLSEPKPWTGFREGGFLEQPVSVVRLEPTDLQAKRYAITASRNGDMSQTFAGLDVLAKTPWKINRGVFDVMAEAWNSGEAVASIPPEDPTVDLPPEPPKSAMIAERLKWLDKVREAENFKGGLRSQRCFQNFQLEVARAFLDETFYFPHNIDFRGRAYPMAPFLNHMGSDNARGLLMFAEKRILGPSGLWWLKVHLANVFGYDKASFQERLEFTEKHLLEIIDSAQNGLHGGRWWLKAEDPWQCLAACKELAGAMELPDPSMYRSSLAIHQDGTCNGLQHYAALGGDIAGAKQVNLEPGDRPSDIYTAVAEMIKLEVKDDAAKGHALATHLDGKITRKVVKQTVMTNVYGVTFLGAKRQVRKQLDLLLTTFPDTRTVNRNSAATYIARKIFSSLAKMFNGAHDIQYWFGDCARRICSSISPEQISAIKRQQNGDVRPSSFKKTQIKGGAKMDPNSFTTGVIWTTPLKMPVVQSYHKRRTQKISTNFQMIEVSTPSTTEPIDKAKQLQAFPPNFIHSLDATHMFLTALKCHQLGLTFAAVHDSFWTHAGDVDTLNGITRDAFIRMHSENIIDRLRAEFEMRYRGHMQLASVHHNSVVGKKIRAWRKANGRVNINTSKSPGRTAELLLESKRLELLASDHLAQRNEGQMMVTPCSLYEESTAEERILAPSSILPVALGQVSTRQAKLKADQKLIVGDSENAEPLLADGMECAENLEIDSENDDVASSVENKGSDAKTSTTSMTDDVLGDASTDELDAASRREAKELKREQSADRAKRNAKAYLWVPLTFPPVPAKGEFDVSRLRDSQYFFS